MRPTRQTPPPHRAGEEREPGPVSSRIRGLGRAAHHEKSPQPPNAQLSGARPWRRGRGDRVQRPLQLVAGRRTASRLRSPPCESVSTGEPAIHISFIPASLHRDADPYSSTQERTRRFAVIHTLAKARTVQWARVRELACQAADAEERCREAARSGCFRHPPAPRHRSVEQLGVDEPRLGDQLGFARSTQRA